MSLRRHVVVMRANGVVSACSAPPVAELASPAAPHLSDADIEAIIDARVAATLAALSTPTQ